MKGCEGFSVQTLHTNTLIHNMKFSRWRMWRIFRTQKSVIRSRVPCPFRSKKRSPETIGHLRETKCLVIFSKCLVVFSKCFVVWTKCLVVWTKCLVILSETAGVQLVYSFAGQPYTSYNLTTRHLSALVYSLHSFSGYKMRNTRVRARMLTSQTGYFPPRKKSQGQQ